VAETRDRALVVDLDGTLYRGDGPVRAYAELVAADLPAARAADFLSIVDKYLTDGVSGVAEPELLAATDGWEAVARLATARFGVGRAELDAAFLGSRRKLAEEYCFVEVPGGFLDVLRTLRPSTRLVLATNSPALGLAELLARLDANDIFDEVVSGARKPFGLPILLGGLACRLGVLGRPWRLFSVGDHWHNDIEPAREFGAITGYIDRFGRADGPADVVSATLEGVLPTIVEWSAGPDQFSPQ
jgi:FMN phosphatase YigB (HAD superfamily)